MPPVESRPSAALLVASPQMADPNFSRSVVLLCDFNEEGALGIVVSRDTPVVARQVLGQLDIPEDGPIQRRVLWGGPVRPGAIFLTFLGGRPGAVATEPVFRVLDDLHVTPARTVIAAVAGEADRGPAFLSLGYAGWAPGQLDAEIRTGSWIGMDLDLRILFETPVADRYDRCLQSLGVSPELVWMRPVDE